MGTSSSTLTAPSNGEQTREQVKAIADLAEKFSFLDRLRDSGKVNMFAASPVIERRFGLPIKEARVVLSQWMETYDEASAASRARSAIAKALGHHSDDRVQDSAKGGGA